MDRRQLVVQRAREIFRERLEDVLEMVRQDRQDMRGWEEPAHVRAAARRTIRENGGAHDVGAENVTDTLTIPEFGRGAGEPERGQQREAMGQLLEAGSLALQRMTSEQHPELSNEQRIGLECVVLLYGRPSVLVHDGRLASVPPFWNLLEDQREDIEMAQRGVGRIELLGHPEYDWAGTGFLVNDTTLLTTRRTAEYFIENMGEQWQFRPGISAWMDYRSPYQSGPFAGYRVRSIIGVHPSYDLALLEVEAPQMPNRGPTPLALASRAPERIEGRPVYLIGYPLRDARRNEPEYISRIFRDVYNVKRIQPGTLQNCFQFREVQLLRHDCAPLGQTAGSCLVDLETHQVLALQLASRYLENGTAIPLWVLREDPLFRKAGVTFAEATPEDLQMTTSQVERLARSRYWTEARSTIAALYQRAFGNGNGRPS